MTKASCPVSLLALALDREGALPLHAQLAEGIRALVHDGRLRPGDRLPSSRSFARELGVSRLTVTTAYDQLAGEGYLEGRRGAGMFVAPDLSGLTLPPRPRQARGAGRLPPPPPLRPFDPAVPETAGFPHREWARLADRVWRDPDPALLGRSDPLGWGPLREAIAAHLRDWRGLDCTPEQVVVTSGLAESLELIAAALLERGAEVAVEEPGHPPLRVTLERLGMTVRPVPVDEDGLAAERLPAGAGAVVVTPSRQFPLGMVMPLPRRLQLLDRARRCGAFVIEDDFDGEYRYRGRPLPALTSLDREGRVIYVGSFSKVMFPALRLGFAVFPGDRIGAVRRAMRGVGPRASILGQPVLARFMAEGRFATHLRRMRRLYVHRQDVLLRALARHCGAWLEAAPAPAGMQIVATPTERLRARMDDAEASARAAAAGIVAPPLSAYHAGRPRRQGLVLGYAGFGDDALAAAAQALGRALAG